MVKFDFKQGSSEAHFCDKNVFLLTKGNESKTELETQFTLFGMKPNTLDITNISEVPPKKTLLLVKKDLLPNLDQDIFREKLNKNHYVYTFSAHEDGDGHAQADGHITLPLIKSEVDQILSVCHMKSNYQGQINQLNTSLINLEKISALGQYTGSLVHDLNNYNTICMTALDGLKLINNRNYQDEKFTFLVDKGLKGSRMINSLSQKYRKFLSSNEESDIVFLGLNKLIKEAVSYVEKDLNKFSITVKVEIPIDFIILTSEVSFIQVIMNLLKNSIYEINKKDARWISIKIKESDNQVSLYIVDSGEGISKDLQAKIFDPLFSTKPNKQGTGFGLSFCRSELKRMGMNLRYVESKFTVFSIEIPKDKYKITMIN